MRKLTVLALLTGLAALGTLPAVPVGATPSGANDQITFARQIPTGGANVFIANPDGSDAHQVYIHGQEDIYTANADGSNLVQVTNTPEVENGPDWGRHPPAP
jgi:hypothetical protein